MLKKFDGFTLLELLIAVAVVGILGAVAYPAYVDFVQSSNRTEAQRELLRLANLQEQYFVDHRVYTDDMKNLGAASDPFTTEHSWYSIDATLANAGSTYKMTATAKGSQASDTHCAKFHINEIGQKTATSTDCWE